MHSGFWTRALRHPSFATGVALVSIFVASAILSTLWTPWPPADIDIPHKLSGPTSLHWLGTDSLGHDVLSQLLVGSQNSLLVGSLVVGIGLCIGGSLGLLAAAHRGWIEDVVMRFADFTFAFPALLSAILLTAIYGPGLIISIVAIGLFNIPIFARVARGAALSIWSRDYILAAKVAGKGALRITWDHVLPNIVSTLIVQATVQFALAIFAEAALSYLGLGTQPPIPSWGRMLNDAQTQLFRAPYLALYPGMAIVLFVLGLNLLGDGLRDLFDPKLARNR